ncbi:MAG: hypothetical protein J5496_09495 [Lachnospiraceae bacterium]|nr:hypothetical protein [Lachnospiraceae bacterium]
MKKFIALALAALMLLSLAACGNDPAPTAAPTQKATETQAPANNNTETKAPAAETTAAEAGETKSGDIAPGEWETKGLPKIEASCLDGRVAVTSIGQSADVDVVMKQLKKLKIDYYDAKVIEASSLTSSYPILICVVGGSSKGLGGAGLNEDEEAARVKGLLDKAKELGTKVVMIHNGGLDRRGTLSDKFINLAFPYATYGIVLLSGDEDNLMKDILALSNVPSAFVEKTGDVQTVLKWMFGK